MTDWESKLPAAMDVGRSKGSAPRNRITDELTGLTVRELTDKSSEGTVNLDDPYRAFYLAEFGAEVRTDGDDNPRYARPKQRIKIDGRTVRVRLKSGKNDRVEVIAPGDVRDAVVVKPATRNPAGEMVADGHGFIVDDPRSRPWKTARRTHCAHCGGEMPIPDVSKHVCEFDSEATGFGCRCSGCTLRDLVATGQERNKGQPRVCCSSECTRLRDNERKRWKAAVARAEKRGEEPPPEPEDKGLKLMQRRGGLRSAVEGTGHRYVSSTTGLPGAPRA